MKYIYLFLSLIYFTNSLGQDLIVTTKNDSILCKITKEKSDFIYFTFKHEGEIRNTLLPRNQITYYEKNYFKDSLVDLNTATAKADYSRFQLAAYGGYSYMIGKINKTLDPAIKTYYKQLKSGYNFGAEANYFISEIVGLGIGFSHFTTSNEMDNVVFYNNVTGEIKRGKIIDDISVNYFGPVLTTRFVSSNNKTQFYSSLSFGYASYENDAVLLTQFNLTSGTVAMLWSLGIDFMLDTNISLGLKASLFSGNLYEYEVFDGTTRQTVKLEKGSYESISRIDITPSLKYNF